MRWWLDCDSPTADGLAEFPISAHISARLLGAGRGAFSLFTTQCHTATLLIEKNEHTMLHQEGMACTLSQKTYSTPPPDWLAGWLCDAVL